MRRCSAGVLGGWEHARGSFRGSMVGAAHGHPPPAQHPSRGDAVVDPTSVRVTVACMKGRKAAGTATVIAMAVDPHTHRRRGE